MKNAGIISAVTLGIFALILGAGALNGLMLSYLWQWFIVPLGVRSIGVAWAMGLAIIASILTHQTVYKNDEAEDALNKLLLSVAARVFAFGIAYALSFWVAA